MNADIRISVDFWVHPKTGRLIRALGLEGVRSLQILWMWAARNRPDGMLSDLDESDIEYAADWRGEAGAFFSAIIGKWLDDADGVYTLHDWRDHNPWVAEFEERSDAGRLSRLGRDNAELARQLRAEGKTGLTKEEYAHYSGLSRESKALHQAATPPSSNLEAPLQQPTKVACAPVPVPVPTPVLEKHSDETHTLCETEPPPPAPAGAPRTKKATNFCTEQFELFWDAFGDKRGREPAWNAWRKIKGLDRSLAAKIIAGAKRYAEQRPAILSRNGTPKMAQGWLNDQRWKDEGDAVPQVANDSLDPEAENAFKRLMGGQGEPVSAAQ